MYSLVAFITFNITFYVCYSWTSMSSGGMSGVTYASGTIYNANTMCPSNVNQGYVCDGRNFGANFLDAETVRPFCSDHRGTSRQFGFGHGVTSSQRCGQCAQLRVQRSDGSYNYMTVMMVDHFTWSMEVGTTEIAYLVDGTQWVVGDRANFDFRIVGDYNCYADFSDDGSSTGPPPTPPPIDTPSGPCTSNIRCGAHWADANSKCGACCAGGYDSLCNGQRCFADLSMTPCDNGVQPTPQPATDPSQRPTDRPTLRPTDRPTQRPNSGGGGGSECGVSAGWGAMTINPYWGSNTEQFFAFIYNREGITSFAIRGADQSNDEYQDCMMQNANFWQCYIPGGISEPASVRLSDGENEYYGINIIESMTGSTAQYPLTGCSGRFTFDDEGNESGVSWTVWFAICVLLLLAIGIIGGICIYKKRMKKGKGYVSNKGKEIDTVELRDNDGMNVTKPNEDMIEVNNNEEIEVEIEAEVPMTTQ